MTAQDRQLRSLLARVRRRWSAVSALGALGRAAAAAAVPLAAATVAAWLLRPAGAALVALAVAAVVPSIAAAAMVLQRARRSADDCQLARYIEERAAESGDSAGIQDAIVSAVQVSASPERHAGAFADLVVTRAVRLLEAIEPSAVVSPDAVRRAALEALVGAAVLAAAAAAVFPHLQRAGATAWVAMFPSSVEIAVLTGDARVRAGQPLRIAATVSGRGARLLGVVPTLVVMAGGQQRAVEMHAADGGFAFELESIDRSFQYRVTAGSAASQAYTVTALFPPRVTRIDVRYEYPAFTRLAARQEPDGGDIYGPAGTRVRLVVHADKPLRSGEIALTGTRAVALSAVADAALGAELVLSRNDSYRVRLTDADGLRSPGELEYFIRVMDDRPPDVHIVRPSADQGITPLEEVAIEARADDDYGIARFELVYAVNGREGKTVPFARVTGTDVAKIGSHLLAAEDLRVQPGDVITYYARARDVPRGKRSSETRSDIFFLEVKPFNEEFVAAQSQAMGGGPTGTQIDSLIAAQKEIINATWNLERRAAAGRSAADLKAVGEAQAELKARVQQMLTGARGRSGPFVPQQIAVPPQGARRAGANPVAAAAEAMGRAIEQLQRERTADAIPHEMMALQGLLQAQAEVRRRQVMQQAASAAGQGGTSRTDRDLSALFDRELQREQRTNYETPKPAAETPEREDSSDAADRIRDLARRQEDLARQQRELAGSGMSAEEMRRQLERLTREQQELRRQAEALQQELRREGASGSASGRGGQDIGRASDEMQRAATEMQRQNPSDAAGNAAKAAETLRRLERELRGGNGGARERAAGEVRLEAQQIADAQRRMASEMSRLDKLGRADPDGPAGAGRGAAGPSADAARRLAGEKDKLADRIDELQRAARELERAMPGADGAPFRAAVQQLQGQQVGARMRQSAGELRARASGRGADGGRRQGPADAEQQLSRALDSVVDALGGGQADGRRLTDELDRTRAMRDRLDSLEQRVREAEAEAQAGRDGQRAGAAQRGRGGQSAAGTGSPEQRLERAREEYSRELQRARDALRGLQAQRQDGGGGATPEQHEYSRSAPGHESFKQDFSGWSSLRKDIDVRLERHESDVAARLAGKAAADRLSAGGSDRVPDAYRQPVSRYFESLAKGRK